MRYPSDGSKPLPVLRLNIQERARTEAMLRGIENFKASDGWFRNWKRRFNIGCHIRLYGEAGDVNPFTAEPLMQELRDKLEDYDVENVFNMDETGLFYRALPTKTYLSNEESRSIVRGTKELTAKDRVTLVLCVNATGTCKVPPLIIGNSKYPHCFRDEPCPLPYTHQSSSWMDRNVYQL